MKSTYFADPEGDLMNLARENIMEIIIIRSPRGSLEAVLLECPDLTWNKVFFRAQLPDPKRTSPTDGKRSGLYAISSATPCNFLANEKEQERKREHKS